MTFTRFPALSRRRMLLGLGAAALGASGPPGLLSAFAGTSPGRPTGTVTALAFDQGRLLLAATGTLVSRDGGASFEPHSQGPGAPVAALATHPDLPGVIYAATPTGLVRSVDAGLSWQGAGPGLPGTSVDAVAIAAHDPQTVYAALRGDGLWQSKDGAKTWDFAMDRPLVDKAEVDISSIASVGSLSGMGGYWVYAGTGKGISKVPDCFCRWSSLESGGTMDMAAQAKAAPIDPSLRLPHLAISNLALAPSLPSQLFAGLPSGTWRSQDTGATWTLVEATLASPILAVHPADPNHIVAADAGGAILSSRDGGTTWAAPAAA